jgi:hypothetical protein
MRREAPGKRVTKTEMAKRNERVEDEQQAKREPVDDDEESRVDCVGLADEEMRWDIGSMSRSFSWDLDVQNPIPDPDIRPVTRYVTCPHAARIRT